MKLIKKKVIQVFSNGSVVFYSDIYTNVELFKIYEKDYKNFFLFKKKIANSKKLDSLSNYKNKYLF